MELPKLVRDRVPECIIKDDLVPIFHYASQDEYILFLKKKLAEEFGELMEPQHFEKFMNGDFSELADVLDVLDCLLRVGPGGHIGSKDVAAERTQKAYLKGRFENKIILEKVMDRRELR
jgi:predicted house-cleaning noncanonical NTP pyrophosphatase (MazG superfamily)